MLDFGFIKKAFSTKISKGLLKEIPSLIIFVAVYGAILNYIAAIMLGCYFGFESFLAYGFGWYFLKYEIVKLFHMFRGFK